MMMNILSSRYSFLILLDAIIILISKCGSVTGLAVISPSCTRIFHPTIHSKRVIPLSIAKSRSSYKSRSTNLNLFWKSDNDKQKSEKDSDTKKQKSPSSSSENNNNNNANNPKSANKMGTTAVTMENFKQSQELGKKTGSLLQELSSMQVEGVAAKGKIKIFVDGLQQPVGVEIDDDYFLQQSAEAFSDELLIAMQDAHKKSMQIQQERMQGLYSTLGLPTSK